MEMNITEEQLEKLVWKEPIWQTDPGCSKPGCGYPDGKPCIGCGRTMTLELFIAEASRFHSQRDALDQRLKAVTELARQGLRLQNSLDDLNFKCEQEQKIINELSDLRTATKRDGERLDYLDDHYWTTEAAIEIMCSSNIRQAIDHAMNAERKEKL